MTHPSGPHVTSTPCVHGVDSVNTPPPLVSLCHLSGIAETCWFTLGQTGSQRDSLHQPCRTAKVYPQGAHEGRFALRCAFLLISLAWVWWDSHTAALCSLSVWGIHQKISLPFSLPSHRDWICSLSLSRSRSIVSRLVFPPTNPLTCSLLLLNSRTAL